MVTTTIIRVDPLRPDRGSLREAAEVIRRGGLVAFPTETVYGLGADTFNREACERVFRVKRRPMDNPLIIHIDSTRQLEIVSRDVPEKAYRLIERLWPGPLTLILRKSERVPREATGGLDTVAVRMPAHPVALGLIELSETPIAAPSANISGKPSPTRAEHVIEDFYGKIDVIIDGGETLFGIESTIVNILTDPPVLLRPGAYPVELIEEILGERVRVPDFARGLGEAERALAPGTRYRHYAPEIPLVLVETERYDEQGLARVSDEVSRLVDKYRGEFRKVFIIATRQTIELYRDRFRDSTSVEVIDIGSRDNYYEIAKNLFEVLRRIDRERGAVAVAEGVEERSLGLSIMNRLRKASTAIVRV